MALSDECQALIPGNPFQRGPCVVGGRHVLFGQFRQSRVSGGQDDPARGGDACRRGGIGDGIEEDHGDGQVAPVSVIVVGVGLEHEGAGGHGQRGDAAHDEHGQGSAH